MQKQTILDVDIQDKVVLLRVDFNVEMNEGKISDDSRIKASIPTISYLKSKNAKIILCSHFGRPGGEVVEDLRMAPISNHLSELLNQDIECFSETYSEDIKFKVEALNPGDIIFLENLRFNPGEEKNDPEFSSSIASLADVFVQDGFGVVHRAHASTEGVTHFLPSVAGLLVKKEIDILSNLIQLPESPMVLVLGGAKISDKIGVIQNFMGKVDTMLIGGGMAGTFLKAQGLEIGKSMVEDTKLDLASEFIHKAKQNGINFILPQDVVIAESFEPNANKITVDVDKVPSDWYIMDIGHKTLDLFKREVAIAKTVLWNGPMGVFEFSAFRRGTIELAATLGSLDGVTTVLGGGSTAEVVESLHISNKITHVSTGGGATLEFLEGKELPGIAALMDK